MKKTISLLLWQDAQVLLGYKNGAKQSQASRQWRPWLKSTEAKTAGGNEVV